MCKRRQKIARRRKSALAKLAVATGAVLLPSIPIASAYTVDSSITMIPIATNAYGVNDLNSCAINVNNLTTVGNYQYTCYYKYDSLSEGTVVVGRRALNSSTWTLVTTPYQLTNSSDDLYSGAIDDHDIVAMAVDGNGDIHLSWGMHNNALNYAISNAANGSTFSPAFVTQTPGNNSALFNQLGTVDQVTYPQFYNIPTSNGSTGGNLVFDYRNAANASGGGSGDGNTFFGIYNASTQSYASPGEVINGGLTSVNGYQNRLVYTSNGNLLMTWTWRSTPAFQTNNNIMFAQSPNNGISWYQQGGSTPYTLPIIASTSNGGSGSQVAQVVENIAQNSSLINQTSMTVDKNNNPFIATFLTPNGNAPLPVSATNNPNMQYELYYYTGTAWAASQITHRTSDTTFDTNGGAADDPVRDLGRPIVLIDSTGRVLVVGRSEDTSMGSYDNASTANNNLTVYWNTVTSLDSASPAPWKAFPLDTASMGEYELTYDQNLWTQTGLLDLFYEPVGISGETNGTAQVLQWNEGSFNFSAATPSVMTWDASSSPGGILDGSGTWNLTNQNFSDGYANYAWSTNFSSGAIFGAANGAAGVVTLGANIKLSSLIFNAPGSGAYNIAGGGFSLNLSSGMTIQVNANATISAPIISSSTLYKMGVGTLTLSGNNTITGTLQLGMGNTSNGAINGGVCITTAGAVNGLSTVYLSDNNGAYDLFQLNGSNGSINLPSSLTFELNANSAGTNGVAATILESIAGNNAIAGLITFQVGGKGYGFAVDAGSLTFTGNQTTSSHLLYLRGAGNGFFSGAVSGSGSIEVDGPGTWTLSNVDTYSGSTNVAGGSLNISSGASITSTGVIVDAAGTLNAFGTLASGTTLLDAGIVNFEPNSSSGTLTRTLASLNLSSGGVVNVVATPLTANRTVLVTAALILAGNTNSWSSQLNLANNDLVVRNGSIGTITNQLKMGYSNGAWNGSKGITSSAAAADSTHLTALAAIQNSTNGSPTGSTLYTSFDSVNVSNSDVLIKYTYYGDINLNGEVDGTDYSRIDSAFGTSLTGWYNGDFNDDGIVDGSDYTLIDNAFNMQGVQLTSEVARIAAQIAAPSTAVPEPTALGLPLAILALLGRRRSCEVKA